MAQRLPLLLVVVVKAPVVDAGLDAGADVETVGDDEDGKE